MLESEAYNTPIINEANDTVDMYVAKSVQQARKCGCTSCKQLARNYLSWLIEPLFTLSDKQLDTVAEHIAENCYPITYEREKE